MRLPSNTSAVNRTLRLLLTAALGWAAATQLSNAFADDLPASIVGLLLGIFVGAQLQLLVHELGHALVGMGTGLRLVALIVGKLVYQASTGLRFEAARPPTFGVTVMLPPLTMTVPQILRATRAMVLGGPVGGLLFSAVCWWGCTALTEGGLKTFLGVTALLGAYLHLLSLLPGTRRNFLTDGAHLLLLWPGGATAGPRAALLSLLARLEVQRPSDWPSALVETADHPQGEPIGDLLALQFTVNHALDTGDLDQAERLLNRARTLNQAVPEVQRSSFWTEEVYLLALQGRAAAAREQLGSPAPDLKLPPATRCRLEAAILLAEEQPQAALNSIEIGRDHLDTPGTVRVLEEGFLNALATKAYGEASITAARS